MILRKTTRQDVVTIMAIIEDAKIYLKENGVDQWQNGYPNLEIIQQDIVDGVAYVLEENDVVVATAMLSFDGDEFYPHIREGAWLTDGDYLVIHRMAVAKAARGTETAAAFMAAIDQLALKNGVTSIRIDTHPHNIAMQKLAKKTGFSQCGVVTLGAEGDRLAFEKVLAL